MIFAHDTEEALATLAAFVNTAHGRPPGGPAGPGSPDGLADLGAIDAFVAHWRLSGSRAHDVAELDAVRALRSRLERLWQLDEDGAVQLVNTLLRDAVALPQLVRHDGWDYHLHATSPQAPLADRMAVEAAMAVVDVIRGKELDRLRVCAADDCRDVMVDLSKNRSRRFCGTTCANRTNVAAFRARRAGRGGLTTTRPDVD
jgi:predicted RNA-binding Zn ribbon-like protein